jgi:putative copper resistance protein D
LFAFVDGLLDAVPGIVVMTTVEKYSGAALLAVAESVGVPMIFAVLIQWVRSDTAEAAAVDARLDAAEADGTFDTTPWWIREP